MHSHTTGMACAKVEEEGELKANTKVLTFIICNECNQTGRMRLSDSVAMSSKKMPRKDHAGYGYFCLSVVPTYS